MTDEELLEKCRRCHRSCFDCRLPVEDFDRVQGIMAGRQARRREKQRLRDQRRLQRIAAQGGKHGLQG